ncbi:MULTISPECIES: 5-formyltetrahydrofolate cyclo-ligase [Methylosinus]|uniref:5-formyltetrahydrofolate cyclo-ligase n=1 Tax=Methylosinus trichosporium (strain ATCC 35070 / NCIMB 11131 / UNIQEM 75 / OB3b) TaxID=595536 RepID=A0A2D2D5L2_METT3|nr:MULTISPECIES: 5-formyltetrahydrofolate cyclo-ligase [Methylosinus]ATQ70255.1 5-formyltetrahydrofolate cyclo-ligase [Methylosinus trichosporium OB3b]OBS50827.1 5-formyltetrahydrofolate cyclo-ligase [Methylosinus sp. 3S-1]
MTVDVKADLRRHALARRDLVTHVEAHEAALAVASRALALSRELARRAEDVVSVYWPIRSELNTRPLLEALADAKIATVLPVMTAVKQPLVFRAFTPGDALVKGPFGLSEPSDDKPALEPDIVFSPLAAFDRNGCRLGYGGGIYDATLAELRAKKRVVAIGIAYACQEAEAVPTEPHDQRLDFLLTEQELIAF